MNTQTLPLNELTRRAVALLTRELGVVETLRFLSQYTQGSGDYTAERSGLLQELTVEELLGKAKEIDARKGA